MRLVTYVKNGGPELVGIHTGSLGSGSIVDVARALDELAARMPGAGPLPHAPSDMLDLIRRQDALMPALRKIEERLAQGDLPPACVSDESAVTLRSPVPRPTSMRDGYAFRQHVEAARRNRGVPMIPEFDHFPVFYFTNHLAVTGPGDVPVRELARDKLDFELEAAIVVGKPGKNIEASKADEHIFGYLVMNDWSARTLQMEEMKLNLGPAKGKDFATSLGPYLVTRDELKSRSQSGAHGERHDLRMQAFVNGKQVSDGNLKDMSWTFGQILERASYGVQLHVGEVIGSGTVGTGCFLELNGSKITDNWWLKPGDEVVMEIEMLGRLVNRVVAAD
jgi:fumarylacetoacetate (FAA) hydrolase